MGINKCGGGDVIVTRRPLDNGAGSVFIAESARAPLGHCSVFHGHGRGVYSTEVVLELQSQGQYVRQEHCVFEFEIDSLATGVALMASVIEHTRSVGGDLLTVSLYREAYEEFFPEKKTTTWLRQIVESAGFTPAPSTEGAAMMLQFDGSESQCEDAIPESVSALPGRVIVNPGNPARFAAAMVATADNIEQLLASRAYLPGELAQLEQKLLTARLWSEQYGYGQLT